MNLQVFAKYFAYWPLFVIFTIISLTGAFFYLRYATPKYEADAEIVIKDEKKGDEDSQLTSSIDLGNSKKIMENEVEVLQSRTLMNKVVKKLHLYAPISQKGSIRSISAYTISPLAIEVQNIDHIRDTDNVVLEYDKAKGTVLLDNTFKGGLNVWLNTPYGVLKFIPNQKYSHGGEDRPLFFSLMSVKEATAGILSSLKVTAINKLSSVIDLSYRDESSKRAEDILNELLKAYTDAGLEEKSSLAKNTLSFIEARLNVVSKDLDSIESKLQRYKAGRDAVNIGLQGQLYLESVSANDKKLSDLNMQIDVMDQLESAATTPSNAGVLPSTLGVVDPSLSQQLTNLNNLQLQYDKLKGTVAENNPLLASITSQINQVKPTILSNIQNQRKSLEQNRSSLNTTGGKYNSMLSSIPQKERQLVEISRDQNIKNGIYSFLLQKREETELSSASTIADSRVVNYAESSQNPVSPKRIIIYVMALAVAFGVPLAYITAKDMFSSKVLYRQEIGSFTKSPIVGEISYTKSKNALLIEPGKRTVMAEQFRKLRVSLLSLGFSEQRKKILVTSSISGEGKSFIAANLATSISLTGKRVVLVDIDLHNPGLGRFFSITKTKGVSEYLMGKSDYNSVIYNIAGNENLFYISSGELQVDSSELLENGKIQVLINKLNSDFDVVIIDSAPAGLITDAYLLSSLCDATLYIVMHKVTPKVFIKRLDETNEINPLKNAAIVFNGVKTLGFFKNNSYGYGNNYVYSYDNKKKGKKNKNKKASSYK